MSLRSHTEKIELNGSVEKVFQYFTDTDEIARTLPSYIRLQIIQRTSRHLTQGTSIDFCAKILGIPVRWLSHVHSFSTKRHIAYMWQKNSFFTSWEHDYYFESISTGKTRVTECIIYRLPCGPLGTLIDCLFVCPFLTRIFKHRRASLISFFKASDNEGSKKPSSAVRAFKS